MMDERTIDKEKVELILQAQFNKDNRGKAKLYGNRGMGNYHNNGGINSKNSAK